MLMEHVLRALAVRMEVMRGWPPTLWRFDEGGVRVSEVDAVGTYGFVGFLVCCEDEWGG